MAGLNVVALSEDTIASPGNRNPNYITVSVTKGDGTPVLGLAKPNFKVDPMIVGPGGALVNITSVVGGRLPGTYLINVVPILAETWKSGTSGRLFMSTRMVRLTKWNSSLWTATPRQWLR